MPGSLQINDGFDLFGICRGDFYIFGSGRISRNSTNDRGLAVKGANKDLSVKRLHPHRPLD